MKRHLPFALTTLRLLLGPIALACALTNVLRWIYLPILITVTLAALLVFNAGSWAIIALTIVALVTNLEIIAIHFLMDSSPVDVRSIFAMPKR